MKKILITFFLLTAAILAQAEPLPNRSNVCLNMIVKNEAHVICRCLESVLPLIDSWVIVDTGSTDGTQEVIRNYMASKNVPGTLYERPWINFAYNRNEALELARNEADYLLFMDADDVLEYKQKNYQRPALFYQDAYYMKIDYSGTSYYRMQLVNTAKPFRWIGSVHEVVVCEEANNLGLLADVTMKIIGGGGRSQHDDKFARDARVLERDLASDPNNPRNAFYLAQSYRDAEMFEDAIEWYEKRAAMGGWEEEVFWSLYQIATIQERMNQPIDTVQASYYRAFNYRPTRAEPLYRIASLHRRSNQPYKAFLLTKLAMQIPEPNDLIFVESWIYECGLLFDYSLSCYFLGLYQQAFDASLSLLSKPNLPDEIRNLVEHNMQPIIQALSQVNAEKQRQAG